MHLCLASFQATWRHGISFEGFVCLFEWPLLICTVGSFSLLLICFSPFLLFHKGDGANDVSMIQVADVGIGISGQEGMQVRGCCAPKHHELDLPTQRQRSPRSDLCGRVRLPAASSGVGGRTFSHSFTDYLLGGYYGDFPG